MSAFLRPLRVQADGYFPTVLFLSETHTASETARLIMDVVATDAFPSQRHAFLHVLCRISDIILAARA
jgi:hypothetical protein